MPNVFPLFQQPAIGDIWRRAIGNEIVDYSMVVQLRVTTPTHGVVEWTAFLASGERILSSHTAKEPRSWHPEGWFDEDGKIIGPKKGGAEKTAA